eukprot:3601604-Pleurochrysis_carterae.AAC.3
MNCRCTLHITRAPLLALPSVASQTYGDIPVREDPIADVFLSAFRQFSLALRLTPSQSFGAPLCRRAAQVTELIRLLDERGLRSGLAPGEVALLDSLQGKVQEVQIAFDAEERAHASLLAQLCARLDKEESVMIHAVDALGRHANDADLTRADGDAKAVLARLEAFWAEATRLHASLAQLSVDRHKLSMAAPEVSDFTAVTKRLQLLHELWHSLCLLEALREQVRARVDETDVTADDADVDVEADEETVSAVALQAEGVLLPALGPLPALLRLQACEG